MMALWIFKTMSFALISFHLDCVSPYHCQVSIGHLEKDLHHQARPAHYSATTNDDGNVIYPTTTQINTTRQHCTQHLGYSQVQRIMPRSWWQIWWLCCLREAVAGKNASSGVSGGGLLSAAQGQSLSPSPCCH